MATSLGDSPPMSGDRTPQLLETPTEADADPSPEKNGMPSRETEDRMDMPVLEGHEASANVTGLIRTVEKYGLVFGELQKLCQKLGVHCNFDSDVDKTFKKIQEVFAEYRQTAERERAQQNQEHMYACQVRERLDVSEADRDKFEALAHRQGQQISQQTDLIDKLEKSLRQAQQQMRDMEERFAKELNEEKKSKTDAHKAHLDAESKVAKLEIARRRAELACQQAMAAVDQQRILFKKSQQENLVWKQRTTQLAEEKRHAEEKFKKLWNVCASTRAEGTALEELLAEEERKEEAQNASLEAALTRGGEMNEIVPVDDDDMPISPEGPSAPPLNVTSQWRVSPSKQPRDLSRTLVLPHATRHRTDSISAFHFTPHYQRRVVTRGNGEHLASEGGGRFARRQLECDSRDRSFGKGISALPQSVVSGPVILGSGLQRLKNRDHRRSSAQWSPGSSDHALPSESTDSATAEDPAIDAFQSSSHYNTSITQIDSYDYGGSSSISSPPTSDDYDSVRGSAHRLGEHRGRNPLRWARKGRDNIWGGVRSGVSAAAKGGVELSRNVWTWATIVAVTAGNVCLRQTHFADAGDFSDLDETESEASLSVECFKG